MKKNPNNKIYSKGFSLLEIMIVLSISVLIGLAGWAFRKNIFSFNTFLSEDLIAQQEGRQAFKSMSAEIRSLSPSSTGSYPISQVSTSSFTFYSDIDDDGLKERIRYFLDENTLKKGFLKPTGNPLEYVGANETVNGIVYNIANNGIDIFKYYDSDYDGTTAPLSEPIGIIEVRLVKITIYIDQNPLLPPDPIVITTQVSMRNLKDNL